MNDQAPAEKPREPRLALPLARFGLQNALIARLIGGFSAAVTGVFLSYFLAGLVQIVIVRQLGRLLYGEYALLTATLGLLASLLGFGLDVWVLSEGGRNTANLARNIAHVLRAKIVGAAILLACVAIAWSSHIVETPAFVIGTLGIIFDSLTNTGYSALRALYRNGHVAVFQVVAPLLMLGALGLLRWLGSSLLLLFSFQASISLVLAIALLWQIRRMVGPLWSHRFDLRYLIGGAWLFVAADVLSNIYTQSSVVILGRLVDQAAVGLLKPALNVIGFTFLVPTLLFLVGLPQLNAVAQDRQQYRRLLGMLSIGAAIYGLAAMVALWFFNEPIIHILFGREYDAALPLVRLMSLVPLLKSGSFVCVAILLSQNRQLLRVGVQAIVTAISIVGGLLIIPVYGLLGAVWLYIGVEALIFGLYFTAVLVVLRKSQP